MELIVKNYQSPVITEFLEQLKELNLTYYASSAAIEMEFNNVEELYEAITRSMEVCYQAGLSIETNFKGFYQSSYNGIVRDWKLSRLAYELVCLNGRPNQKVAQKQIGIIKSYSI